MAGVYRRNPRGRVSVAEHRRRLARRNVADSFQATSLLRQSPRAHALDMPFVQLTAIIVEDDDPGDRLLRRRPRLRAGRGLPSADQQRDAETVVGCSAPGSPDGDSARPCRWGHPGRDRRQSGRRPGHGGGGGNGGGGGGGGYHGGSGGSGGGNPGGYYGAGGVVTCRYIVR